MVLSRFNVVGTAGFEERLARLEESLLLQVEENKKKDEIIEKLSNDVMELKAKNYDSELLIQKLWAKIQELGLENQFLTLFLIIKLQILSRMR